MGWVLSCETGFSEVSMPFCCPEDNIVPCEEWRVWDGPRAVGDPMHVETSFVRNLGGLMPPAAATSGPGPVGEARKSEARPEGMRSRTTA